MTHEQAVNQLRTASAERTQVQFRLLNSPETDVSEAFPEEDGSLPNFMPSWIYWLQLPK